ncbi:protein translocase subunit secY/sec61 alpha [Mycoplasma testudineum]|uniref:Protein translocase subunit SecY n=1 Tax=Mycoplasma testudineum TaxID=244584 RepID=A0A4R6IFG8_9MOLU|nr:preprotein translocase subunit SecY [Mycoplasma testudineum]OYD27160.1 preprotein translocase subunit SecY [Mycoplasma testudineum]TDO21083.1 protein translocase subunit secY/sec61 alpha [Mycoplasma testudineum]
MKGLRRIFESFSLFFAEKFFHLKKWFVNFWSEKIITKKVILTLFLISIFVIAGTITAPFVILNPANNLDNIPFFSVLNLVGGGGLRQFSIMSLGIQPFITASLVMTILQSRLFPPLHRLSKSGPLGRRKINIITRALSILVAYPQSLVLTQTLTRNNGIVTFAPGQGTIVNIYVLLPLMLTGGAMFAVFLGETITDKGVGNGTSLLIFAGIASGLPTQFQNAYNTILGIDQGSIFTGVLSFIIYLVAYLLLLFIMTLVNLGERKIPIQQVGAGLSRNEAEMGSLPIKVNPAGIMPVIFANIVLSFPQLISGLLDPNTSVVRNWIENNFTFTSPIGLSALIIITFIFSIFMGLQQSKVDRITEDFGKNGTFIPGLRPGEETEDYLIDVVLRLSLFSAFYLSIIVGMQYVMIIAGVPPQVAFGGTGMMILVSVSLETLDQISARRKTTNLSRTSKKTRQASENEANLKDGVLW